MTPRDLLLAAGHLVHLAELAAPDDRARAHTAREYSAIGAAMRGALSPDALDVDTALFTSPGRLGAWYCASRACRILGPAATPRHARHVLVTLPRLDLDIASWAQLLRETEADLDIAEHTPGGPRAAHVLVQRGAVTLALAALRPALETLLTGRADPATIIALRGAADLLEVRS